LASGLPVDPTDEMINDASLRANIKAIIIIEFKFVVEA
jgi:hypothetical protein